MLNIEKVKDELLLHPQESGWYGIMVGLGLALVMNEDEELFLETIDHKFISVAENELNKLYEVLQVLSANNLNELNSTLDEFSEGGNDNNAE